MINEMVSMTSKSVELEICEDKISTLNDDLLIHILLHLPTKDVVATMFLSKRWRSIWKMVPRLYYKESVWTFFDKSFQEHKAPILESLYIDLDNRCPIDADVNKWIARAADRCVRKLELNFKRSVENIGLCTSLYTCETLVELRLSNKILIDVPSSVCLSSLKKLELKNVAYKDEVSVVKLLSSCPVLELLTMHRFQNDNLINIMVEVPSLKIFSYATFEEICGSLILDCPALKELVILDFNGESSCWSKNIMPYLDRVFVHNYWFPGEKFMRSFSSIKSLTMYLTHAMVNCCSTVNFPRLTSLAILPKNSDWLEPLMLLLKNSPILKKFVVRSPPEDIFPGENTLSWKKPISVPKCLSSNLEVFQWYIYDGRTEENEFAAYMLGNSKCLKKAEFHMPSVNLEVREKMCEEFNSMYRVSATSQLKIYLGKPILKDI